MQKTRKLDTCLYMRISEQEKEKLREVANYYGIPSVAAYIRELIRVNVEKYDKEVKNGK